MPDARRSCAAIDRSPPRAGLMAAAARSAARGATMSSDRRMRVETDTFGPIEVPADRYWGAQTQRSLQNFRIGSETMPAPLVRALGIVKRAAAKVNREQGVLEPRLADADHARRPGGDRRQARRALPAGGLADRLRHPEQHERQRGDREPRQRDCWARRSAASRRSTPTITSTAASPPTTPSRPRCTSPRSSRSITSCCRRSSTSLAGLQAKAAAFKDIVKIGRTHLQDATPLDARPGVLGLRPAGRLRHRAHASRPCRGSASSPRAAPRSAPA